MQTPDTTAPRLLKGSEVASMLRVSRVSVIRWADKGLLTEIRTPGGHRRYLESEVRTLLDGHGHAES